MEALTSGMCQRSTDRGEVRRKMFATGPSASARFSRKRPSTPKQQGGIHRRRRKKIQW